MTRKSNIVNDQQSAYYDVGNELTYKSEALKSNLCDYNDAYMVIRGGITVTAPRTTWICFKNCATFSKYITKIDGTIVDVVEALGLVMPCIIW